MPIAVWSEKYETGIDEIDAQHKYLFAAINRLSVCFKEGNAGLGAREALDFLNVYTREHFEMEEQFMRMVNYPMLSFHQSEHTELLAIVQSFIVKMDEGFLITADIATLVANWLTHHINESDMGYVQFFKEKMALTQHR